LDDEFVESKHDKIIDFSNVFINVSWQDGIRFEETPYPFIEDLEDFLDPRPLQVIIRQYLWQYCVEPRHLRYESIHLIIITLEWMHTH
jgi:hypothetical protein